MCTAHVTGYRDSDTAYKINCYSTCLRVVSAVMQNLTASIQKEN